MKRKRVALLDQCNAKRKKLDKECKTTSCEHAVQEDSFIQKIHARPIREKYVLDHKLGEGGFGMVFLGRDITIGREVALKLEHRSVVPSILDDEAEWCKQFQHLHGFPKIYWYGWHDDYKVMAFELLGPSLEDLFAFCGHRFSLKTTFMLMNQLLERLKNMHSSGIVHRDITPQNCLMGTGTNGNVVYITDFGLAKDANLDNDPPETSPVRSRLLGTARYASIKGHEGRAQSFKDDLESLGYNMIYFARGKLPWQGLKGRRKEKEAMVMEEKKSARLKDLCTDLLAEFVEYMKYVRQLEYGEMPDYARIGELFRRGAASRGWEDDDVFDWTVLLFLHERTKNEQPQK